MRRGRARRQWKQHTREFLAIEDQRLSDYRIAQTELKQARAAVEALFSGLVAVAPIDGVQLPFLTPTRRLSPMPVLGLAKSLLLTTPIK